jgi:DNA-directed RNA polymerase subunit RPC12/RpoP
VLKSEGIPRPGVKIHARRLRGTVKVGKAMANPVITCPECSKKFKGQTDLEGKKIRCPFCKQPFVVPGELQIKAGAPSKMKAEAVQEKKQAPPPAAPPPEKKSLWEEEEEGPKNYDLGAFHIKARCPNCAKELLSEADVVCVYCGYNNLTRTFAEKKIIIETTGNEHFMHLLPGLLAAFGMLLLLLFFGFFSTVFPAISSTTSFFGMFKLGFLDSQGIRVMMLFFIIAPLFWGMGMFAFSRLIMNPKPKEKEKD